MKLFGIKASMLAVLTVSLGSCGIVPNIGQPPQPYQVDVGNLGYGFDPATQLIVIPAVTINVTSAPGAPDINKIRYVATLQTLDGQEAIPGNSVVRGLLTTHARGGYKCITTPDAACTINSSDVYYVSNQTIIPNDANNSNVITNIALVSGIWASGHLAAKTPAGWVVRFDYSGEPASGGTVQWSEYEQFIGPAKQGGTAGSP